MKNKGIDYKKLKVAIITTIISLPIMYILAKTDTFTSVGIFMLIVMVDMILFYLAFNAQRYWCANCGLYFGTEKPNRCPRCAHNIYTKEFNGVGDTIRNR